MLPLQVREIFRTGMPVTSEQQHVRVSSPPSGVRSHAPKRFPQQVGTLLAGQTDMHARPFAPYHRGYFLADLRRVLQDEVGGDVCDPVGAPERRAEVDPCTLAERLSKPAHNRD